MVANKPAHQTGYLQAIHHNKSTNLFRTGKRFTAISLIEERYGQLRLFTQSLPKTFPKMGCSGKR